jgi:hypothetical protein
MQGSTAASEPGAETHPPAICPVCGASLSDHPYYQLVPSPLARLLQKCAKGLFFVMAVLYLGVLFWGRWPLGFGSGHGYAAVAFIAGPSLLLYAISRLFPRRHRVMCLRCSWSHEYRPSR